MTMLRTILAAAQLPDPAWAGAQQLVPFLQVIPASERDPVLPRKLEAEWPAILRWMIDGCLDYLRHGLNPPASALVATEDYLESEDVIGQWLNERCVVHPSEGWTSLASLFLDWQTWAHPRGYTSGTSKALSKQLDERGLKRKKTMHGQGFEGVRILPLVQSGAAAAAGHDGNDDNDASSYFTRNPHPRALDGSNRPSKQHIRGKYGPSSFSS